MITLNRMHTDGDEGQNATACDAAPKKQQTLEQHLKQYHDGKMPTGECKFIKEWKKYHPTSKAGASKGESDVEGADKGKKGGAKPKMTPFDKLSLAAKTSALACLDNMLGSDEYGFGRGNLDLTSTGQGFAVSYTEQGKKAYGEGQIDEFVMDALMKELEKRGLEVSFMKHDIDGAIGTFKVVSADTSKPAFADDDGGKKGGKKPKAKAEKFPFGKFDDEGYKETASSDLEGNLTCKVYADGTINLHEAGEHATGYIDVGGEKSPKELAKDLVTRYFRSFPIHSDPDDTHTKRFFESNFLDGRIGMVASMVEKAREKLKEAKKTGSDEEKFETFDKKFGDAYEFFYENDDPLEQYFSEKFDEKVKSDKKFKAFVDGFCNWRKDFISSDREAAACYAVYVGIDPSKKGADAEPKVDKAAKFKELDGLHDEYDKFMEKSGGMNPFEFNKKHDEIVGRMEDAMKGLEVGKDIQWDSDKRRFVKIGEF